MPSIGASTFRDSVSFIQPTSKPTRGAIGALVAFALTVGAGLGCGSSGKLSQSQFISKADAICAEQKQQINALRQPHFAPARATRADLRAAAAYFDQADPIFKSHLQRILALGPSRQNNALLAQSLEKAKQLLAILGEVDRRAHLGDLPGFRSAFAQAGVMNNEGFALAHQFGLRVCA